MALYIVTVEVEVEVDADDEDAAAREALDVLSEEATVVSGSVASVREAARDEVAL